MKTTLMVQSADNLVPAPVVAMHHALDWLLVSCCVIHGMSILSLDNALIYSSHLAILLHLCGVSARWHHGSDAVPLLRVGSTSNVASNVRNSTCPSLSASP